MDATYPGENRFRHQQLENFKHRRIYANTRSGTAAGIGVGAGIGAGIGGQLGNMIQTTFGNLSNTVNVDKPGGIPVSIPPISPNVTGTLSFEKMSKLEGLKELYSQNIITKEQYDSAVADILQSL